MTLGRTLRLHLVDGHPAGLIVAEIMNWTGQVLSFPRGMLPQVLKTRPEVSKTGVYLLVGLDPDNVFRSIVYVGESDDVQQRLIAHDKDENKSYFDKVVLIISKDQNLTKGHVRYLEAKIIEIIKQTGLAQLKNGNLGQPVSLPESDIADMDYFLQQIRVVLPVLGLTFLQEPPRRPPQVIEVGITLGVKSGLSATCETSPPILNPTFELSYLNGQITAQAYESEDGQFVVKAGSLIRNPQDAAPSLSTSYRKRVEQALEARFINPLEGNVAVYQVIQDIAFASTSGASDFVCGAPTSGPKYWRVQETGQTYADWRAARLDAVSETTPLGQEVLV